MASLSTLRRRVVDRVLVHRVLPDSAPGRRSGCGCKLHDLTADMHQHCLHLHLHAQPQRRACPGLAPNGTPECASQRRLIQFLPGEIQALIGRPWDCLPLGHCFNGGSGNRRNALTAGIVGTNEAACRVMHDHERFMDGAWKVHEPVHWTQTSCPDCADRLARAHAFCPHRSGMHTAAWIME